MNQPTPLEFPDSGADRTYLSKVFSFARACNEDPELLTRAQTEPLAVLAENGVVLPPGIDARIVENTPETFHLAFPPDPNMYVTDEELGMVAGGKTGGTAGSVSSTSTVGTAISTVGSGSSVGSVGTAGTGS